MKIPPRLIAPLVYLVYRLWCSTLRLTETNRDKMNALRAEGKPIMIVLWHEELFPLVYVRHGMRVATLVSRSTDGEYLARLLNALGFKTSRGSSSRGGLDALLKTARLMRDHNYTGCIAVDGPRGPRHVAKDGAVFLAVRTPAHIVPVRMFADRAKVFASWDKFQLPLPFSRVRIVFGDPYLPTASDLKAESIEKERLILQDKLNSVCDMGPEFEKDRGIKYWLYRKAANSLGSLSRGGLKRVAGCLGFVCWRLLASRRNEAIVAVKKHLHVSQEEAVRIARQSFTENFLSFLEIFHVGKFFPFASQTTLAAPELLEQIKQETGPIVVATAHLGSWELMPGLATDAVPDRDGMVIVRSQKDRALNKLMQELRGARGMQAIDHRQASAQVLPRLRKGGAAAFLVDHNCSRKEAVFLPFLEDTAAVNIGPAAMALRTKAVIYPVFLPRRGDGHVLHILPPLRTAELEGSIAERTKEIARFYTDAVASMVRQYPEQWFWMHKRWKTREKGA